MVRALEEKRVYDQLELTSGRMAHVGKGDVLVGALGRRDALRGYVGRVPEKIRAGDTIHVLNLGGVLGEAIGENKDFGHPLRVEVLGMAVRERPGHQHRRRGHPGAARRRARSPPLIVVSGSCMSSGKTAAACEIIARFTARGYVCAGLKLTGVAAPATPSTWSTTARSRPSPSWTAGSRARRASTTWARSPAGSSGRSRPPRRTSTSSWSRWATASSALRRRDDPRGPGVPGPVPRPRPLRQRPGRRLGRVQWFRERGLPLDVIAGPATDNQVGMAYIQQDLGPAAANARAEPDRFADLVEEAAFAGDAPPHASGG